jgi:hypothetical protein
MTTESKKATCLIYGQGKWGKGDDFAEAWKKIPGSKPREFYVLAFVGDATDAERIRIDGDGGMRYPRGTMKIEIFHGKTSTKGATAWEAAAAVIDSLS